MGLRTSDHWLSVEIPKILASDAYKANGVLLITWDEAEGRGGHDPDKIPMIVVSPRLQHAGMTTATSFDHGSYLATVEDLLKLPRLETVIASASLTEVLTP